MVMDPKVNDQSKESELKEDVTSTTPQLVKGKEEKLISSVPASNLCYDSSEETNSCCTTAKQDDQRRALEDKLLDDENLFLPDFSLSSRASSIEPADSNLNQPDQQDTVTSSSDGDENSSSKLDDNEKIVASSDQRIPVAGERKIHDINLFRYAKFKSFEQMVYGVIPNAKSIFKLDDEILSPAFREVVMDNCTLVQRFGENSGNQEPLPCSSTHEATRCPYQTDQIFDHTLDTPEELDVYNRILHEGEDSRFIMRKMFRKPFFVRLNKKMCEYDKLQTEVDVLMECFQMYVKKFFMSSEEPDCECSMTRHWHFVDAFVAFLDWFLKSKDPTCREQDFKCPKCNSTYHNFYRLHFHIFLHNPVIHYYIKLCIDSINNEKIENVNVSTDDEENGSKDKAEYSGRNKRIRRESFSLSKTVKQEKIIIGVSSDSE